MTLIGSLGVLLIQASQQPQHFPGRIWEVRRGQGPSCTASLSYMISARSSLSSSRGQSTAEVLNWFLKHLLVHWLTACKFLLISSLSFNYHKVLNDSIPHMSQWLMVKYLLLTKLGLNPLISEGSLAIGANGTEFYSQLPVTIISWLMLNITQHHQNCSTSLLWPACSSFPATSTQCQTIFWFNLSFCSFWFSTVKTHTSFFHILSTTPLV